MYFFVHVRALRTLHWAGYPALVALKPKDGRYSPFQSAFELQHINEFVDSIRRGGAVVLGVQVSLIK